MSVNRITRISNTARRGHFLSLLCVLSFPWSAFAAGTGPDVLPDIPIGTTTVQLQDLGGFGARVTDLAHAGDGSGRLFVVTPAGTIKIYAGGTLLGTPFLAAPAAPADRAMSGLAFHPDFATNRKLYVITGEAIPNATPPHYSPPQVDGATAFDNVLVEYQVDVANPNLVDASTRRELLRLHQADKIHNMNDLTFGGDGYLYLAVGDGGNTFTGSPTHPQTNAQQLDNPYGKILRIDVDTLGTNGRYGIPVTNPYPAGVVPEIFAVGFRNPWRICCDPVTGDVFTATNGHNTIESVVRVENGHNYGWSVKAGSFLFDAVTGFVTVDPNPSPAYTPPLAEYDHNGAQAFGSVIGGVVYRGSDIPELYGKYICLDWLSARLMAVDTASGAIERVAIAGGGVTLSPGLEIVLAEDEDGELYIGRSTGGVLRVTAVSAPFRRGDCTANGAVALDDVTCSLAYQFLDATNSCLDALDSNDDGVVDISDPTFLLSFLFLGGTQPPAPGATCGGDPSTDALGCSVHPACP